MADRALGMEHVSNDALRRLAASLPPGRQGPTELAMHRRPTRQPQPWELQRIPAAGEPVAGYRCPRCAVPGVVVCHLTDCRLASPDARTA